MSQSVNTIYLLHKYIQLSIKADNFCIDATAGKGKDTVFLANLVGEKGHVLAMDVQPAALEATEKLLQQRNLLQRVELILDGH